VRSAPLVVSAETYGRGGSAALQQPPRGFNNSGSRGNYGQPHQPHHHHQQQQQQQQHQQQQQSFMDAPPKVLANTHAPKQQQQQHTEPAVVQKPLPRGRMGYSFLLANQQQQQQQQAAASSAVVESSATAAAATEQRSQRSARQPYQSHAAGLIFVFFSI
jgi:outer membrane biosynthesis protein TonB